MNAPRAGSNEIPPPPARPGSAYAILLALWAGGAALTLVFALWFGEQFAMAVGGDDWRGAWAVAGVFLAAAVGLPAWIGRRWALITRYRAVFGAWLWAAGFVLCLLPARLAGPTDAEAAAGLQIGGLLLFLALTAIARRRAGGRLVPGGRGVAAALVMAALLALPWVVWGALGSSLDTLLNLLVALLFGLAVARTLEHTALATLRDDPAGRGHRLALGGLAAAAALAVMAAAFGVNGQQLILAVLLPGLGWAVARLGLRPGGWAAAALLVGLATAAPLLFFDPDELNLVLNLGYRDVGYYALLATVLGTAVGWALSLAALLLGGRAIGRRAWAASAILSVVGLALVYALIGQTGWHGERLFVVLRDQANIGSAVVIDDPVERRAVVYDLLTHHAEATQADLRATLDRFGVAYKPYYLVNGLEVNGGPLWRWWLSRRPEVDRVLVSPEVRPLPTPPTLPLDEPDIPLPPALLWSQTLIRAPQVWNRLGITGAGIVVGQNDSGADGEHLELRDNYRGNTANGPAGDDYNWLDPWNGTATPTDFGGHGTHTLATAVGGNVGVAPGATWIACVNLARNLGNPPRYLDCFQFLLAPFPQGGDAFTDGRPDLGAHVINNSWGCPPQEGCDVDALLPAARALRAAGVFVVAAAGNNGPTCSSIDGPLALYDEVFTVGAVDDLRQVAEFSSRGPVTADGSGRIKPDIAAPGVGVTSAVPGNEYAENDGTSMASPHIAGVVALLWSANPALIGDIDRTEQILTETATNIAADGFSGPICGTVSERPNSFVGYGIVNALAAVERALAER